MSTIHPDGAVRIMWREGTWRCESGKVQARPVLRLYDGDRMELEHEVMPGTISVTAEAMRQSVVRYISGAHTVRQLETPRRGDTKAIGPGQGVLTICRRCRSLRVHLRARRAGKDWFFCPDCHHQWDAPSES
jgi:hypothetical protein